MRAEPHEAPSLIEVLDLLECTYGAVAMHRELPVVIAALACAVGTLGVSLSELAVQRGYPHAGALAGALLEDQLSGSTLRRVPPAGYRARSGSPHLEFEDIALGAGVLARMLAHANRESALETTAVRATALLLHALRTRLGPALLSSRLAHIQSASELETLARAHGVVAPAAWRRWIAQMRHANTGAGL